VALAQALAMSVRTLERIYSNERALTLPEVKKVAEVCGVPIGFLVEGWNANRPIHDRLAEIDRRLADVANASGELSAHEGELLARFEELVQRLDRGKGRGRPRSGGAQDFREVAAAPEQ
jgi:transcriptional regulator with XRE-family HTH domain